MAPVIRGNEQKIPGRLVQQGDGDFVVIRLAARGAAARANGAGADHTRRPVPALHPVAVLVQRRQQAKVNFVLVGGRGRAQAIRTGCRARRSPHQRGCHQESQRRLLFALNTVQFRGAALSRRPPGEDNPGGRPQVPR
ncbi:MAG TPA: hypothetical protein VD793_03340 [Gemmatimonadales bacterium]|nr:hypothetical protein [Gemmatimonadales bacterium]